MQYLWGCFEGVFVPDLTWLGMREGVFVPDLTRSGVRVRGLGLVWTSGPTRSDRDQPQTRSRTRHRNLTRLVSYVPFYQPGCISWDITLCPAIHQSMLRVPPDTRVCQLERDLWRDSRLTFRVTSTWRVDSSALTCECLDLAKARSGCAKEAQWPIGYGVGLRIKRSSVRIRPCPLRWVLGQGSLLPLSQGEAFTLASISYLAILVKYTLVKKKKKKKSFSSSERAK